VFVMKAEARSYREGIEIEVVTAVDIAGEFEPVGVAADLAVAKDVSVRVGEMLRGYADRHIDERLIRRKIGPVEDEVLRIRVEVAVVFLYWPNP
jgi:hypothetical protein